jgi:hypothetical protein
MGYKVLGYVVWHVGKLVVRRKARGVASTRNLAIAGGVLGVAIAGALVAGSRSSD